MSRDMTYRKEYETLAKNAEVIGTLILKSTILFHW